MTDQPPTDLRDRIAEALYAHDHPGHLVPLNETGMGPAYRDSADAVLAVLPPPADRAAVLREAADTIEAEQDRLETEERARFDWVDRDTALQGEAVRARAAQLRRMASEAQQQPDTETPEVDVDSLAHLIHDADVHVNNGDYPSWDDLSDTPGLGKDDVRKAARWLLARLHITMRAEAQQDGARS